jgi:hypothetical protein
MKYLKEICKNNKDFDEIFKKTETDIIDNFNININENENENENENKVMNSNIDNLYRMEYITDLVQINNEYTNRPIFYYFYNKNYKDKIDYKKTYVVKEDTIKNNLSQKQKNKFFNKDNEYYLILLYNLLIYTNDYKELYNL